MRFLLGGAAVVLALALYTLWPAGSGPSKAKIASQPSQAAPSNARLRSDVNGLARAFSMAAARTIGTVVISGQVRDRHSGTPLGEAEVLFSGPSGETSVLCDGDGNYRVELMPGLYRGYAHAEGYVAVARAAAERLPGPVSAAAVAMPREGIAPLVGVFRDQAAVHFTLTPGARIRGQITDKDGYAIAGAIVAGKAPGQARVISGSDVTESDGSGYYELLLPAGSVQLEANHERYAAMTSNSSAYLRAGETLTMDLVLTAGCIVEGRVIDSEGELVASGSFEQRHYDGSYSPIGEIRDGVVRFAEDREGPITLRAWPWKSPPSEDQEFRCADGEHYSDATFVIPNADPALTGTVIDADGAPAAFAFVDLFGLEARGATQQERADAEGSFAFFALPEGPYQLSVYVPGKGATLELTDVPSTGVPLRLGGVGAIIGSSSGIENGSIEMRYHCVFALDESEAARSDEVSMPMQTILVPITSGTFRIDDVPACPIEGVFTVDGASRPFSVTVAKREEAILRLSTSSP
tara:strand:- start:150793 stop:152361 length:1569 start_codon:yes stop_codon:yes gene_type:complete